MKLKWRSVFGNVILKNELGWHLVQYSRGYAVRPPLSFLGLLESSIPAWLNVGLILKYWVFNPEMLEVGFLALPFTMLFGFYFLRDTALYINSEMKIVIAKNLFQRRFLHNVTLFVDEVNCLVKIKSRDEKVIAVIWRAESVVEAADACSVLQRIVNDVSERNSIPQKGFVAWMAPLLKVK